MLFLLVSFLGNPSIIPLLLQHLQAPHFYVSSYSGENVKNILLSLTRYVYSEHVFMRENYIYSTMKMLDTTYAGSIGIISLISFVYVC